jgi:putative tryptophan/tyrosine transport system substrate-binding protein
VISRRALVRGLGVGILLPPFAGQAQPADKVWRIGFLGPGAYSTDRHFLDAFRLGLRDHGYVEGQNVTIEARWAEGRTEHFHDLIADLIRLHIDALVTLSTPAVRAAMAQTDTIPIVFIAVDPLGTGLVSSLARPGRNVTGLSLTLGEELAGKWPELLREVVPRLSRVAVLWNPSNPSNASFLKAVQIAAEKLGARLQRHSVEDPKQLEDAFAAMSDGQAQGVIVFPDPLTVRWRARIVDLAAKSRLPAVYGFREFVDAGGLMAYGTNATVLNRRAANYIDKIFKGAHPGNLPVEQATQFEFVINSASRES